MEDARGVDQRTYSSSSETDDGMLKQIPSGDRDVPATGEGVKGAASGLRGLEPLPDGASQADDSPLRRGGRGRSSMANWGRGGGRSLGTERPQASWARVAAGTGLVPGGMRSASLS